MKSNTTVAQSTFRYSSAKKGVIFTGLQGSHISLGTLNFGPIKFCVNQGQMIENNTATYGGGIYLVDSATVFVGEAEFNHNQANISGGSIHVLNSLISFRSMTAFLSNRATERNGGPINVVNSLIEVSGNVTFNSNQVNSGGGISLENSTLYTAPNISTVAEVSFTLNKANFGRAVFVNDESESFICSRDPLYRNASQCFLQVMLDHL